MLLYREAFFFFLFYSRTFAWLVFDSFRVLLYFRLYWVKFQTDAFRVTSGFQTHSWRTEPRALSLVLKQCGTLVHVSPQSVTLGSKRCWWRNSHFLPLQSSEEGSETPLLEDTSAGRMLATLNKVLVVLVLCHPWGNKDTQPCVCWIPDFISHFHLFTHCWRRRKIPIFSDKSACSLMFSTGNRIQIVVCRQWQYKVYVFVYIFVDSIVILCHTAGKSI